MTNDKQSFEQNTKEIHALHNEIAAINAQNGLAGDFSPEAAKTAKSVEWWVHEANPCSPTVHVSISTSVDLDYVGGCAVIGFEAYDPFWDVRATIVDADGKLVTGKIRQLHTVGDRQGYLFARTLKRVATALQDAFGFPVQDNVLDRKEVIDGSVDLTECIPGASEVLDLLEKIRALRPQTSDRGATLPSLETCS